MTDSLALRERRAFCDLAQVLGPDAPTLCEGWDAQDLVAHLLVRERDPISSLGNVVPPLAGLTEKAMARRRARPFEVEVETLRTPSPPLRVLPPLDRLINTFELVVHHEDLRRGQPDWSPRSLPAEDVDLMWSQLRRGGMFFGRGLPVPTVVRRADTGETATMRKGVDPVTVTGDVVELVLFLFGRSATSGLAFEGPEERVAELQAADLGV
ncbi:TIGR03085 family metal-binding protein [Nocardioides sp.]|uniref:TIGR03085 family metal-binding protein n=1 Tax=Nocardioides sp. TaxID=35761 RepID=UPI003783BA65